MYNVITQEMQIETTVRYHITPTKIVKINKTENSKYWRGFGELETHAWQVDYKMV